MKDACAIYHAVELTTCFLSYTAIQILFVPESYHWVATSYDDGKVKRYDSLFQGKLTPSLEQQIVQLYSCAAQNGMIKVKAVPMQQQTGNTDCGLFSIAAAVHVALGDSMADTSFAQEKLRDHLIHYTAKNNVLA